MPESFDLHNSSVLSTELQHGPIQEWFQRRHIQVRTNLQAVDTTGFFDEVAVAIGKSNGVLKEVVDRIRFAQLKGFASSTIHLDKKSPEDAQLIVDFCRQLYDYSFVAKCFHLRQEKLLRLVLQTAPAIREFFTGDWLEWHVFMAMLESARHHKRRYSCARNLVITLQNDETYELDVFFLLDGNRPVCIECKSGEFRHDIDRCLTLRKRLGIRRDDFIMCAVGLGTEQATGLTSMYDLTFGGTSRICAGRWPGCFQRRSIRSGALARLRSREALRGAGCFHILHGGKAGSHQMVSTAFRARGQRRVRRDASRAPWWIAVAAMRRSAGSPWASSAVSSASDAISGTMGSTRRRLALMTLWRKSRVLVPGSTIS